VVAAVEDPYPLVCGAGFAYLRDRGIEVETGLSADRATAINQPYFTLIRERRPFVIMKAAISLDGYIAEAPGRRTQLTSAPADRHAHQQRAEVDAIGVGVGTVVVDDPLLTPRGVYRDRPLVRVIFDRELRTPPHSQVLSTREAGPVIIVATAAGAARNDARKRLEERGAEIETSADDTLRGALACLGRRQIASLVLEGGAEVHRAAWKEKIVDFVQLYVTPRVIGPGGVPFLDARTFSTAELINRRVEPLGPDVLIEGYVHGPR
jgi:diaminohydroxyphosphoribosylaminopyrimidine deaminase/5-amino-6-(5-phosphoribosylamino)uracil reductase